MKKLFLFVIIVLSVLNMNAQKGTYYIGTTGFAPFGELGVNLNGISLSPMTGFTSLTVENDYTTTNVGIAPEVGYFINDNIAVGIGLFYTASTYSPDAVGDDDVKFNTFGFNPYVRYHFINKGNFRVYGQFNIAYASARSDIRGTKAIRAFEVGISPGLSYQLTERIAINAGFGSFGYAVAEDRNSQIRASVFGLNLDSSSLKFGFTISF